MLDVIVSTTFSFSHPVYWRGLSDYECNDPLDPPYCPDGYYPRNWPSRPPVPEVRKLENGVSFRLTESWEWCYYWPWRLRVSLSDADAKAYYRKCMRKNAAFTNNAGSDTCHSWVLGTNTEEEPMRIEGVDCSGGNIYRQAGKPTMKNNRMCLPIWTLDFSFPPSDPREFSVSLPQWLLHQAKDVHPIRISDITPPPNGSFLITNWDYNFSIPLISPTGRQAMVDGFDCRENFIRLTRVQEMVDLHG